MKKINNAQKIAEAAKKVIEKKDGEISRLKKIIKENPKTGPVAAMKMSLENIDFPEVQKVEVVNQPKAQGVQDVTVRNIKDIKFPEPYKLDVKFPEIQKVEVKDHDRLSDWLPKGLAIASASILKGIAQLLSTPVHVRLVREDKINPIYVTPVDENGKIIRGGGGESLKHMIPMMARPFNTTYIPTGGGSGRFTITANTPAKLVSKPTLAHTVTVTSLPSNAGTIFVGINSAVATGGSEQGAMLLPTGSATFNINDVSKIWVDGTNTSDVLTYAYTS